MFGVKFRLVSVYFPDSSYLDAEVHKVYEQLAEIVEKAKKEKKRILIGGRVQSRLR